MNTDDPKSNQSNKSVIAGSSKTMTDTERKLRKSVGDVRLYSACFLVIGIAHSLGMIKLLIVMFVKTDLNFSFQMAAYTALDGAFIFGCFLIASAISKYGLKIKSIISAMASSSMAAAAAECAQLKMKIGRWITFFYFPAVIFMITYELGGLNPYVFIHGKYPSNLIFRMVVMLFWLVGYPYAIIRPFRNSPQNNG